MARIREMNTTQLQRVIKEGEKELKKRRLIEKDTSGDDNAVNMESVENAMGYIRDNCLSIVQSASKNQEPKDDSFKMIGFCFALKGLGENKIRKVLVDTLQETGEDASLERIANSFVGNLARYSNVFDADYFDKDSQLFKKTIKNGIAKSLKQ